MSRKKDECLNHFKILRFKDCPFDVYTFLPSCYLFAHVTSSMWNTHTNSLCLCLSLLPLLPSSLSPFSSPPPWQMLRSQYYFLYWCRGKSWHSTKVFPGIKTNKFKKLIQWRGEKDFNIVNTFPGILELLSIIIW